MDAPGQAAERRRAGPAPERAAVRGIRGPGRRALMASRYIANPPAEQREMLRTIGASSIEDLLIKIPPKAGLSGPLALRPALAEADLVRHMRAVAARNADADRYACFQGAGSYDHYVPSPINHLISRGEFFTAYTPYQPEASQGTLRTIYEYQTMIAELTGMDVANASIYDGASSLAEAALMAHSVTERTEIVLARGVNPLYRRVVATYCDGPGIRLRDVPAPEGVLDAEAAPNLGVFAAKNELVRRMPGRLVGATVDKDGRRGFVLTLQTREQHIRRAKATSNICTNVALCALMATIYLSTIGKQGLQRVGELSAAKAHYAAEQLTTVPGVSLRFAQPFFKEFTLTLPKSPASIVAKLAKKRILPGVPIKGYDKTLADCLLVAVTEQRTRDEIDAYAAALAEVLA